MEINVLNSLQNWYFEQCDGDWEHEYGIKIDTLDNPGWSVTIDLIGTKYEEKKFYQINQQWDDNNWIQCHIKDGKFQGAGGAKNLIDIIKIFLEWKDA